MFWKTEGHRKLGDQVEIVKDFIYADNWLTIVDAPNDEYVKYYVLYLNECLKFYGLEFSLEEVEILPSERVDLDKVQIIDEEEDDEEETQDGRRG